MYSLFSLLLLVTSTVGSNKPYYDLADAEQHFAEFVKKYEKYYESDEEHNKHFQIFKDKLDKINYWNEIHEASFDINQYTDQDLSGSQCLSNAEMNITDMIEVKQEWIQNAPATLDYRTAGVVSRVKHQHTCLNCYVFAAVANIESRHALQSGKLVTLSEQQATDCGGSCEHGGFPQVVMDNLSRMNCLVREDQYPYVSKQEQCTFPNTPSVKVKGYSVIKTDSDEQLMGALAQFGPLAIGLFMSPSLSHFNGNGALSPYDCPFGQSPNHAVLLVGYTTDQRGQPHWIIKNSWGPGWGDNGYLLLARGSGGRPVCSLGIQGAAVAYVS